MLMNKAAILGFELGRSLVPPTFQAGNPTSGSVPVDISNQELGNSDFSVQIIISLRLCVVD